MDELYEQLEKVLQMAIDNNLLTAAKFINNCLLDFDLHIYGKEILNPEDFKGLVEIMKEVYEKDMTKENWKGANW
jgi:hypothetical protein